MEGMLSEEVLSIQQDVVEVGGCSLALDKRAKGLVLNLLDVTHGQWLYRNVVVHDLVVGLEAIQRNQEL